LYLESDFLISAHHGDWDGVPSGDVERSVKYILGIAYLFLAHLKQHVAFFKPGARRRCVLGDLCNHRLRAFHLLRRWRNIVYPDPAVARLAEAKKVAANFLRSFARHSVTSSIIFETANDDPNDFASHVQQRSATLAAPGPSAYASMDAGTAAPETSPI